MIRKCETPEPEAPNFAITIRPGVSTQDPPFLAPLQPTSDNLTEGKQKKDDEDERLLSIFKQIHINLSFLDVMIHMPKGVKVLKDLLSHKTKLEKAVSSVKPSEECSAIIQMSMPQKEEDLGSFTLPCLIEPLAVKNALADLKASINLMPHSIFQRLGISKLKPTRMSIQLADRSIKYPIDKSWPVEPLEWKALENQLNPSSMKPPKLELKELPEHLDPWVSPVQVVPKNRGMTVVKNEKDELIPQQTVTGWRVCIDYHKLNNATQKDHFPLPFIDQMLERLAGHEYYCFLDGFSGYFQIPITPED
nr:RNA-directed DNA polymerase homolog [Tanacetum cinerariifolium]